MKCPWGCGWEGEPEDYFEHLETCPAAEEKRMIVAKAAVWKDKFASAVARMVVNKGRFEKRDLDALTETIRRMLHEHETEWS